MQRKTVCEQSEPKCRPQRGSRRPPLREAVQGAKPDLDRVTSLRGKKLRRGHLFPRKAENCVNPLWKWRPHARAEGWGGGDRPRGTAKACVARPFFCCH